MLSPKDSIKLAGHCLQFTADCIYARKNETYV